MARREFHLQDGASNKFWAIELGGKTFTVQFGRMGTDGQTQTKDFSSEAAAKAACEKLIAEKVKKGYQEVTASQPGAACAVAPVAAKPAKATPAKKPAAKVAMEGPLLSQLPKRLQKLILEDPTYTRFARLSLKECLATCWDFEAFYKSEYGHRRTDEEIAQTIADRVRQWPKWSADQIGTAFSFLTITQECWLGGDIAAARRILREDPAELAVGVCLGLRCWLIDVRLTELATGCRGQDHRGGAPLRPAQLPLALAVRDLPWAQQVADHDCAGPGVEELAPLESAILAAYRRDREALRGHLPRGKVYKYDEWKWSCLRGIAANDPEQVRAGLQKELERNRSSRAAMEEAGFGIVNVEVHGFYRLCEYVSPELVSTFDVRQSFPWDVEFHDWVQAHDHPLVGLDLSDISPVLHDGVVSMKMPAWWTGQERRRPNPYVAAISDASNYLGALMSKLGASAAFVAPGDDTDDAAPAPKYGIGSVNDEMLPIAVSLDKLEAAVGSKDTALLNLLVEKFKDDIASDDRFVARQLADGVMPDEDDEEGEPDEDDEAQEASRLAMLESLEQMKQRLLHGQSLEQAMASLDDNPAVTEPHKDAIKELMGALGELAEDAISPAGDGAEDEDEAGEEGAMPPPLSIAEMLRCLIMGGKLTGHVPYKFMHGCALRYLALHFGEELPHEQWNDFSSGAFRDIGKAMRAAGIPAKLLSLDRLVNRGAPIPTIPKYQEGLTVGYLRGNEINKALAALAAAHLDLVDEDCQVFIEDIQDWLRTCADSKRDLLCFSVR